MRFRSGPRTALLTLITLSWNAAVADGSAIRYQFRGTIDGLLTGDDDMGGVRHHDRFEAAGSEFGVGDPFDATLVVRQIPPSDAVRDHTGEFLSYRLGGGDSTFEVAVGGRTFGRSARGGDLFLNVQSSPYRKAFDGYQQFGEVDPTVAWSVADFDLAGTSSDLFRDPGMPTLLPIDAFTGPPPFFSRRFLLQLGFEEGGWLELTAVIDAIEVTIEDDPVPGGPIGPGPADPSTPVPEPGMMTLFGGMALAVLARRRLRGPSAG
ncbi:hypothetical protein AB1L88_09725 [Tautonia sp. JC769]|uniref:hypothetical protein n=1 Tax=Tautonia sp. JC769 TaxID=3232135 RepID=UPI003457A0FF